MRDQDVRTVLLAQLLAARDRTSTLVREERFVNVMSAGSPQRGRSSTVLS